MIYKKPLFWILVLLVMIAAALLALWLTQPGEKAEKNVQTSEPSRAGSLITEEDELVEPNLPQTTEDADATDWLEIDTDIADYLSFDKQNHMIYFVGLNLFEEFGTEEFGYANEGSVQIDRGEKLLYFGLTVSTGSVTGALDGPTVSFEMSLETHNLLDKSFEPAPDYLALGLSELAHYSKMMIEPDDARLIEVGEFFETFIMELEVNLP